MTEGLGLADFGCNTKYCIVARQQGRLGAQASAGRVGTWRWGETRARGALRHCRLAPTIRQPVRSRYGHGGLRHARGKARRGAGQGACGTGRRGARGALRHDGWGYDTAGGLGHDMARPAHDTAGSVRAWACLLGLLGACAFGLVFQTGFRLGDIFESPFGPSS